MPLSSLIAGPLISAAGGLVGNLLGFGSQSATNKANMKLAEYQYEKNLEMWNRNNEYNTPLAQRQRMEAAGFNPNLVYGHGSVANTSTSVPQYSAPTLGAYTNFSNIGELALNSYLALKNSAADVDLKESAAEKNRADAQNLRDENGGIAFKNKILEYQSLIQKNLSDLENERSEWYHLRAGDEYEKLHQEITNMLKSFDKMVSDIDVNEARVANLNADTNFINGPKTRNTNSDTVLKGAQTSESHSRTLLNRELAGTEEYKREKINRELTVIGEEFYSKYMKNRFDEETFKLRYDLLSAELVRSVKSNEGLTYDVFLKKIAKEFGYVERTSNFIQNWYRTIVGSVKDLIPK